MQTAPARVSERGFPAFAGVLPLIAERVMGPAYELLGPILLKSSR
jgi:hypothetical protein